MIIAHYPGEGLIQYNTEAEAEIDAVLCCCGGEMFDSFRIYDDQTGVIYKIEWTAKLVPTAYTYEDKYIKEDREELDNQS
jgi:hypothetical protein